jgi:beta-lactamase regulating signal transducer with metallopeptidase domain
MNELFLKMVNLGVTASYLALAVTLIRVIFRKVPKRVFPFLWGLVALRLLFPFSIESPLSLIPSGEIVGPEILVAEEPAIHSGIAYVNRVVNPILKESLAPDPVTGSHPVRTSVSIAFVIWVVGVAVMLLYALISYLRLKRDVKTAVRLELGVWKSERIASPFVLGLIRPQIYLPFSLSESDVDYVLAHERAHIARKDHWIKPLGYLLLSLHWFNPVMWIAYVLFCRDVELACDERVIKGLNREQRADYSQSLLTCSISHGRITACPLAFGEIGVKERVKRVLNYKKPTFWVILAVVAAGVILAVCFLTYPPKTDIDVSKPTETEVPKSTETDVSKRTEGEVKESWPALADIRKNYSAEEAEADGCVVMDGETMLAGEKAWADFENSTAAGREAKVRIYQMYAYQRGVYTVKELSYDGSTFLLQFYDSKGVDEYLYSRNYKYLVKSLFQPDPESSNLSLHYLLSDDPNVTAEGYLAHMFSSYYSPDSIYNQCERLFSRLIDNGYLLQRGFGLAFIDIDNDGIEEKCCLGYGPTSGVATFTLTVFEGEQFEYAGLFSPAPNRGVISFFQEEDGTLKVQMKNWGVAEYPSIVGELFDIVIRDGTLVLVDENGETFPTGMK